MKTLTTGCKNSFCPRDVSFINKASLTSTKMQAYQERHKTSSTENQTEQREGNGAAKNIKEVPEKKTWSVVMTGDTALGG